MAFQLTWDEIDFIGNFEEAYQVLDALAAVGVDMGDVSQRLENEGIAKFIASWHELQQTFNQHLNPVTDPSDAVPTH